jgi:hypothetical protein
MTPEWASHGGLYSPQILVTGGWVSSHLLKNQNCATLFRILTSSPGLKAGNPVYGQSVLFTVSNVLDVINAKPEKLTCAAECIS